MFTLLIFLAAGQTTVQTTTYSNRIGDVNGDGFINSLDLAIVKASFGKRTGQSGYNPAADVNGDGIVVTWPSLVGLVRRTSRLCLRPPGQISSSSAGQSGACRIWKDRRFGNGSYSLTLWPSLAQLTATKSPTTLWVKNQGAEASD